PADRVRRRSRADRCRRGRRRSSRPGDLGSKGRDGRRRSRRGRRRRRRGPRRAAGAGRGSAIDRARPLLQPRQGDPGCPGVAARRGGARGVRSALARSRRVRATVTTLAPHARPHRRYLVEGTLATIVLVAARLAFPWPLRGLLEIVFHKGSHGRGAAVAALIPRVGDPVWWLVGAFVAIILLWGISESLQRLMFTRFAVGLVRDSRAAALAAVPDAAAAGKRGPGDLIAAVTGDAAPGKNGVKAILIGASRNATFFLGVTIIVSLIDPLVGLVFFAGGLGTVVVGAIGAWRSARIARRSRRREGGLTDELHRHFAEGAALS